MSPKTIPIALIISFAGFDCEFFISKTLFAFTDIAKSYLYLPIILLVKIWYYPFQSQYLNKY